MIKRGMLATGFLMAAVAQALAAPISPSLSGFLDNGKMVSYELGGAPYNGTTATTYSNQDFARINQTVTSSSSVYTLAVRYDAAATVVATADNFSALYYALSFTPSGDCSFVITSDFSATGTSQAFTKYSMVDYTAVGGPPSVAFQYQSSTAANFSTTLPSTTVQLFTGHSYKLLVEIQNYLPEGAAGYTNITATAAFGVVATANPEPACLALLCPACFLLKRNRGRRHGASALTVVGRQKKQGCVPPLCHPPPCPPARRCGWPPGGSTPACSPGRFAMRCRRTCKAG